MNKPICFILIGIPCSGKSTWAKEQGLPIISCDEIRKELSPTGKLKYNPELEAEVWATFYNRLPLFESHFIVDNTNCKVKYINAIVTKINPDFEIRYVVFDIPLRKAKLRNIVRWMKTGKWIPMKVMDSMYKNFNDIKHLYK